ncbi:uncharacterized protein LOC143150319 [Ptiloglossa arizonensis]|uniref:uncharacterized protein LOC143150319 n=1 Tax=Ptiloglossa arizonensis TaxID=3350558 RepID=UPI003FA17EA2
MNILSNGYCMSGMFFCYPFEPIFYRSSFFIYVLSLRSCNDKNETQVCKAINETQSMGSHVFLNVYNSTSIRVSINFSGGVLRTSYKIQMGPFLTLFTFLTISSALAANSTCPENEIWNECGSACPSSCENPEPRICIQVCSSGCFCKDGFLRNSEGQCVDRNQC